MSGQAILNSVFSCSSAGAKTFPKRKLRQTRSLDPALMRNYGTEGDERGPAGPPLSRTPADHLKRSTAWDLPLSLSGPAQPAAAGNIFSPMKWLQKSVPQVDDLDTFSYSVWKSGDIHPKRNALRHERDEPVHACLQEVIHDHIRLTRRRRRCTSKTAFTVNAN
ncbi:hypothetical protein AOLI_G00080390 [Acnodon oligacanthus]